MSEFGVKVKNLSAETDIRKVCRKTFFFNGAGSVGSQNNFFGLVLIAIMSYKFPKIHVHE